MAIAYIDPLTSEPVEKERWRWVAIYNDDTFTGQFNIEQGGGVFHKFADIDQARVNKFMLVHDSKPSVIIYPPQGAQLVHFYSTRVAQRLTDDGQHTYEDRFKGYVFGYRHNGNDYGILVDYDDTVQVIDDFKTVKVAREVA